MAKLRIVVGSVVTVVAFTVAVAPVGAAGAGTSAAPVALGRVQDLSASVAMDCAGEAVDVAVSVRVPRVVRAGQAFSVTSSRDGAVGALRVALSHTSPEALFVGSSAPSTTQVVARGAAGQAIAIDVSGATRIDVIGSDFPPNVQTVTCTPVGAARIGSVVIAGGPQPAPATSAVDVILYTSCVYKFGFPIGADTVRISFTVPTRVAPGEVFSLPDLTSHEGGEAIVLMTADGAAIANPPPYDYIPYLAPFSSLTTTAPAGGEVSIRLLFVAYFAGSYPVASCSAVGSPVLATIPVVAP